MSGLTLSLVSLHLDEKGNGQLGQSFFYRFDAYAYATVTTLAIYGLLVSFILKYSDNVAKFFCAALSMLCVALLDSAMKHEWVRMRVTLGIVLTGVIFHKVKITCQHPLRSDRSNMIGEFSQVSCLRTTPHPWLAN